MKKVIQINNFKETVKVTSSICHNRARDVFEEWLLTRSLNVEIKKVEKKKKE